MKRRYVGKKSQSMKLTGPPPWDANIKFGKTLRFYTANSATADQCTTREFLQMLGVATSSTVCWPIFMAMRVKRITIWGAAPAQGAVSTVSVLWNTGTGSTDVLEQVTDTSANPAQGPYISTVPPRNSSCALWFGDSTVVVCFIAAPAGSVMDVEFDGRLADGTDGTTTSFTIAGGTAGVLYTHGPQGNTSTWVPIGRTTA